MFLEDEYNLYKKIGVISKNAMHMRFSYYPINLIIKKEQGFVTSNNILLGNSATPTNNHIEAFEMLKKFKLDNINVITPLSYGKTYYFKDILEYGFKYLGKSFQPLKEFIPLDKYRNLMSTCGIVIMNHYRPQGVGNVMAALHMGAKVYLSKRNPLYNYLKRIECYVYSVEDDLHISNQQALQLLNSEQMEHNRKILNNELSFKRIVTELRGTLKDLVNESSIQ